MVGTWCLSKTVKPLLGRFPVLLDEAADINIDMFTPSNRMSPEAYESIYCFDRGESIYDVGATVTETEEAALASCLSTTPSDSPSVKVDGNVAGVAYSFVETNTVSTPQYFGPGDSEVSR